MKEELRELSEELKRVAPRLLRFKRAGMSPPPPGYFERLPEEVLRRIRAEEASGVWRSEPTAPRAVPSAWWSRLAAWVWRPAMGLALAAVLVWVFARTWEGEGRERAPLAQVPATALHDYVERRLDEFGEELLWELAPAEELSLDLPVDDELLEEVGNEWLEELSVTELEQLL